jgi:hypothetical protein
MVFVEVSYAPTWYVGKWQHTIAQFTCEIVACNFCWEVQNHKLGMLYTGSGNKLSSFR